MPHFNYLIVTAAWFITCLTGVAVEEYSNGRGGGFWSDPATWRSGAVPGPDSIVVIGRDDNVIFDRHDVDRVTCGELHIDKNGRLSFKTKAGSIRASFGGVVESYGAIRLDGTARRDDRIELRLVGRDATVRKLNLRKGGSLTAVGRTDTADGKSNVVISAVRDDRKIQYISATLTGWRGSGLDIKRAQVINITIMAHGLDNTGAQFNERLNITESLFIGNSNVNMNSCDTPLILNNRFERQSEHVFFGGAVQMNGCKLPEIRGNEMIGKYQMGVFSLQMIDGAVVNNLVDGAGVGLYWDGGNVMIQDVTIRNCGTGVQLVEQAKGAIDGLITENCKEAINYRGYMQISNWTVRNMPEDGRALVCHHGVLELINSSIEPAQVVRESKYEVVRKGQLGYDKLINDGVLSRPMIQCTYYLVAGLEGDVPTGARVEVRTANPAQPLAPGAIDPNIRNSPAPILKNNLTPLPGSLMALMVNAWRIETDGTIKEAPTYTVSIQVPGEQGKFKTIKSVNVTPDSSWFRAELRAKTPTVGLSLP